MNPSSLETLLSRLEGVIRVAGGHVARCPAHDDHEASLSVSEAHDGKILVCCHAGCPAEQIVAALGLGMRDLFPHGEQGGGGSVIPFRPRATVQPGDGCTLAAYAAEKRLPLEFLAGLGLTEINVNKMPAVRIPYRAPDGQEEAVQFRVELRKRDDGTDNRFRFKARTKPCPYGLERLAEIPSTGELVLVEGASDTQTLWYHDLPALGLPGAASWRESWAAYLEGPERIIVPIEPDKGGETLRKALAGSRVRDRIWLVYMPAETKDVSALHIQDPEAFAARWQELVATATPLRDELQQEVQAASLAARQGCRELAEAPSVLDLLPSYLASCGVAGEARVAKLLYLAITSRLLERPVSIAVKGPSGGGKSFLAKKIVELFPPEACYELTAMSEHALAYFDEPMAHRILVIYEAAGMENDLVSYLVRSLLSEGRIRYVTVEKTAAGLRPRTIELEGPTGLLVTTTAIHLHPENETRTMSVTVTDTQEQTRAVLRAIATSPHGDPTVAETWRTLQLWLAGAEHRVAIPFAPQLAEQVPPVAVRLRRDFGALLSLIEAHVLLHQANRGRDTEGRIVATLADYGAVRELMADLVAEGVGQSVSATTRETVQQVARLLEEDSKPVTYKRLAEVLDIDKSAAQRRARVALDAGYLRNEETRRGQPAKLRLGEALPDEVEVLPSPGRLDGCTVARETEGIPTPLPLPKQEISAPLAAMTPEAARAPGEAAERARRAEVDDSASEGGTSPEPIHGAPHRLFGAAETEGLRRAAALVVDIGAASIALLVRRFGVHEAAACSMLEALHDAGIVGPDEGHQARSVIADEGEVEARLDAYFGLAT